MTKYNTGNPVGSADPRDLYDNAENTDVWVLSKAKKMAPDRLGFQRKTWYGIESEFAAFIAAGGYVGTGTEGAVENYAAGIEITGYNQIVRDASGEFWRLSGPVALPYTTTGAGLPEGGAFVAVGDAVLRQQLNSNAPGQGTDQIRHTGTSDTVTEALTKRTIYVGSVADRDLLTGLADGQRVEVSDNGETYIYRSATDSFDLLSSSAITLSSTAGLATTTPIFDGQVAIVKSSANNGWMSLKWDASSTETANGFSVFSVSGLATGRWIREYGEADAFSSTQFGPLTHIHEGDEPYTAWPFACLFTNPATNEMLQAYSGGPGHLQDGGKVFFRALNTEADKMTWSGRKLIADREAENFIATTHAAARMPNGDYVVFVRFIGMGATPPEPEQWIYRSTDGGLNWTGEQWKDSTNSIITVSSTGTSFNTLGGPHGIYVTRGGTVIVFVYDTVNGVVKMYRSTDPAGANGTYTGVQLSLAAGMDGLPLEGSFVEDPYDNTIICYARRHVGTPAVNPDTLVYTVSTDDGVTWSTIEFSDIDDAFDSPCAFLEYPELGIVECFWNSRRPHPRDGLASLYQSVATYEDLKSGTLNHPTRIGKGPAYNDYGYVAVARNPKGDVLLNYYMGNDQWTSIITLYGNRNTKGISTLNSGLVAQFGTSQQGWRLYADGWAETWKTVAVAMNTRASNYTMPIPLNFDTSDLRSFSKETWSWPGGDVAVQQACGTSWLTVSQGQWNLYIGDTSLSTATRNVILYSCGYLSTVLAV